MIKMIKRQGFTLVEIMIVMGILALIAAVAYPNINRHREKAHLATCMANLRQIDYAKDLWSIDAPDTSSSPQWSDLVPTYLNSIPTCPSGGVYTIGSAGTKPTCDIEGHEI